MEAPLPSGPAPVVFASPAFGDAPLEGFLYLRPSAGSENWGYEIDLNGDGKADRTGFLASELGLGYTFTSPGIHPIQVTLRGSDGTETIEVPVVVNDPDGIQLLAQGAIPALDPGAVFEGIAVNRAGSAVFVGDYVNSRIYRLDSTTLSPVGSPVSLRNAPDGTWFPQGGAEGLSVTPSDTLLLVGHKSRGLSVVALPSMEVRRRLGMNGEFYIQAVDDTTAIISVNGQSLDLIDTRTGATIRSLAGTNPWHFAFSPSGDRVAVLDYSTTPVLRIATLPDLQQLISIPLTDLRGADIVAFDPAGDRAYVLGFDPATFVLVDLVAGRVLRSMKLAVQTCFTFCVANPVATIRSGRYVAMEQGSGVLVIDTALDLPRFLSPLGRSVAASPTEEAFYILRTDGLVSKVTIGP